MMFDIIDRCQLRLYTMPVRCIWQREPTEACVFSYSLVRESGPGEGIAEFCRFQCVYKILGLIGSFADSR